MFSPRVSVKSIRTRGSYPVACYETKQQEPSQLLHSEELGVGTPHTIHTLQNQHTSQLAARLLIAVLAVVALVYASCAPVISRHEKGAVTVRIGSRSGSRAVTDVVASFSSITVAVSGADMGTVSETVTGYSLGSPISLEVPAGNDRLVTVTAVPAASAPTLATEFGGSATVDVEKGKTASANVALVLTGTKIVLPDYLSNTVLVRDSISSAAGTTLDLYTGYSLNVDDQSDLAFDQYGRPYFSTSSSVVRFNDMKIGDTVATITTGGSLNIALDEPRARLYCLYDSDGTSLFYQDFSDEPGTPNYVYEPSGYSYGGYNSVAVDEDGYVYVAGNDGTNDGIMKLSVPDGSGTIYATLVAFNTLENLGVGYYPDGFASIAVTDLQVVDGVLYILGSDVYADSYSAYCRSRGKVVAAATSNLGKLWETGWSGDSNNFPTSETNQFYGPVRFVGIAPRKLYIADDGFGIDEALLSSSDFPCFDVNRVLEVDTESGSVTAVGQNDSSELFATYSGTYIIN